MNIISCAVIEIPKEVTSYLFAIFGSVDKTRTKHGCQTGTTIHDILSTRPAQSMITEQQQQYMTNCRLDPHEAWSKTATIIHDILSIRPAQSMVEDSTNNT